jgi:hypothetical protein
MKLEFYCELDIINIYPALAFGRNNLWIINTSYGLKITFKFYKATLFIKYHPIGHNLDVFEWSVEFLSEDLKEGAGVSYATKFILILPFFFRTYLLNYVCKSSRKYQHWNISSLKITLKALSDTYVLMEYDIYKILLEYNHKSN